MRGRRPLPAAARALGVVGACLAALALLTPELLQARVESWAMLLVGLGLFALVRLEEPVPRELSAGVVAVGTVLAGIGVAQALGAELFNSEVRHFAGRRVLGTVGNPSYFGVCVAAALPFAWARARSPLFAAAALLMGAAVVLSGARTAWAMAAVALLLLAPRLPWRRTVPLALCAAALGVALAAASAGVDLGGRLDDLARGDGTAAGRLYLWRVHPRLLAGAGPIGGGPGAFALRWPEAQSRHLEAHPTEAGFYSDLRHAHADLVEVATDWGWVGLALSLWGLARLLRPSRRRAGADPPVDRDEGGDEGGDERDARVAAERGARASLVAMLVGGLASPVLFQLPTLALAATCAAILAPRAAAAPAHSRGWIVGIALALAVSCVFVGLRAESERLRNVGLRAEIAGELERAAAAYGAAAEVDDTNPLAHAMVARAFVLSDPERALRSARRATELLPSARSYGLREVVARRVGEHEEAARAGARAAWLAGSSGQDAPASPPRQ